MVQNYLFQLLLFIQMQELYIKNYPLKVYRHKKLVWMEVVLILKQPLKN